MPRDRLREIAAIRERGGWADWRPISEVGVLEHAWDGGRGPLSAAPAFVIIRLVTILEVFSRGAVTRLIDHGGPYAPRAPRLVKDGLKLDFAIAQALVGKSVTLGELVANDVSINSIGDVDGILSTLLDRAFFTSLAGVVDRFDVEIRGRPHTPIIADVRATKAALARLFDRRHVLVHELPEDQAVDSAEVSAFVADTSAFLRAADQALSTELLGAYPLTQADMNEQAGRRYADADHELTDLLEEVDPDGTDARLHAVQEVWTRYRELQGLYRSGADLPGRGTVAPMIYGAECEKITLLRIKELKDDFFREEGVL